MSILNLLFSRFFGASAVSESPLAAISDPLPVQVAPVDRALAVGQTLGGAARVIDGDTLMVDGVVVRLWGIEAPASDQPWGVEAKYALIRLCRGKRLSLVVEAVPLPGLVMARCRLPDGRDLAAAMVQAGHALDWPLYSQGEYRALETREARARFWRADMRQRGEGFDAAA
ncbi:thermonuclease family protein [Paragemmobacter straminiformis]|uniref:Thermonuclease family protein n=1 Tax=Paragemmobacter straminiformis TaxID=2045119 RepID=A0A842IFD7_9RHOB|nr:thermonuclease family protein [Gemmobacter straminiformis]MBC2837534.1 thermonuclease family protein [Gemmobacter straminiformis]